MSDTPSHDSGAAGPAGAPRPDCSPPAHAVGEAVRRALAEDLTPLGDVTASLVDPAVVGRARIVSRAEGVLAGVACARRTFEVVDPAIDVAWRLDDGDRLAPGSVIADVSGPLRSILTAERTALNFLGHLSGIATLTRRYVDAVAAGSSGTTRIWDTRKTTPGLRALEKAAVRAGGGANHRGNLSDWVLIKDNHLAGGSITDLVTRARHGWPGRTVHVECDTSAQVAEAVAAGADAVLCDNMTPAEVADCVRLAAEAGGARRPLVEASGGVTLDTVADYAAAGVDCISIGGLTNAAGVLDLGLDLAT
jgi:nicotinate-nucleotide pyrophosphorylase (carboxylating)